MDDGKGYLVPDPPEVEGLVCIKVYVPDDLIYIAAFWGAYEYFTTWLAWARDVNKLGKVAAAVWRSAFDISRAEYELGGGCDMSVTVNNNISCGCGCGDGSSGADYPIPVPEDKTTRQAVGDDVANTWREAMDRIIGQLGGGATASETVDDFMLRYPSADIELVSDAVDAVIAYPGIDIDDVAWDDIASAGGCSGIVAVTDGLIEVAKGAILVATNGLDLAWSAFALVFDGMDDNELKGEIFRTSIYDNLPTWGVPACDIGELVYSASVLMNNNVVDYTMPVVTLVGRKYRVVVGGTFVFDVDPNKQRDGAFYTVDGWSTHALSSSLPISCDQIATIVSGEWSEEHLYLGVWNGDGVAWNFNADTTSPGDNEGALVLQVFLLSI